MSVLKHRGVVATVLVLGLASAAVLAQTVSSQEGEITDAQKLIVMLSGTLGDSDSYGAGIIFGRADNVLYIVTANHVLRQDGQEIKKPTARLFLGRNRFSDPLAVTLHEFDPELDIAVISIKLERDDVVAAFSELPFDRLAQPGNVRSGHKVVIVGRGNGQDMATKPFDNILNVSGTEPLLTFYSASMARGFSGGALLTEGQWRLLGLIVTDSDNEATAVNFTQVIERLKKWPYAVSLTVHVDLAIQSFAASPKVIEAGQASELSWTTTGAEACAIGVGIDEDFIEVPTTGTYPVSPPQSKHYELKCRAKDKELTSRVKVTVKQAPANASISASEGRIKQGAAVTLSWKSAGLRDCKIEPGLGPVTSSGTLQVTPSETTTYTLECKGPSAPVTRQAIVEVFKPLTIEKFSVMPEEIGAGEEARLEWRTQAATACSINQGVGAVELSGARRVAPTVSVAYTLTCSGLSDSASETATIKVVPAVQILSFQGSRSGSATELQWSTRNARSCRIDRGVGVVGVEGKLSVKPTSETLYTLSCDGARGSVSRSLVVPGVPPVRIVRFEVKPERIISQGAAWLVWEAENAESCRVDPSVGAVGKEGNEMVSPSITTSYKLVCKGVEGPVSKTVKLNVDSPLYCCDGLGMKRCPIVVNPGPLGSPCFCSGVWGTGYMCQ